MFKNVKKVVQLQFAYMLTKTDKLFYVEIDRDEVFEKYLNAFTEDERQGHNCNCCKSFLRQYAGIVAIIDGKRVSIWDNTENLEIPGEYKAPINALSQYIHSLPITDVFCSETMKCGTDTSFDQVRQVTWNHFSLEVPKNFVMKADKMDSYKGLKKTAKQTLKRALDEITIDSVETVLDLIEQNTLYRGQEFKSLLERFLMLQKKYQTLTVTDYFANKEDNFCWLKSLEEQSLTGIRNTSIGTLLVDLSEGKEVEYAVSAFEKMVAPQNYKRPTALITQSMIAKAQEKLNELGLVDSLNRRYATETDLSVEDIIYTDKMSGMALDVFAEMSQDVAVNVNKLKFTEIHISDFIKHIVPQSKSIEAIVENRHMTNFVSLITAENKESKGMFKWDNLFSWSYTGGITDSVLKDKVAKLGGRVDGVFRFTHSWNEIEPNQSLMDLHVFMPGSSADEHVDGSHDKYPTRRRVGWNNRKDTLSGGTQDVDYTSQAPKGYIPVENITFPSIEKMPEGKYVCKIHNWSFRNSGGRGRAEIEVGGQIFQYEYPRTTNKQWITVAEVTLKNGQFTIEHKLPESTGSQDKWGVSTNKFVKVKKMMLSPNHWNGATGNKHFMFFLDKCVSDETARPFFNEFLKPELDAERKVFEVMGSKLKVQHSDNQLSGLGFSETQENHLLVRIDGKQNQLYKVKIK